MVKCIHIRNSNKYAKRCGCATVPAVIRPAPYKPPGSRPAVLLTLAEPAAGCAPLAAEGAPGSREAAPLHIPEFLPLHTPRIHAPRARSCRVRSAHCWGFSRDPRSGTLPNLSNAAGCVLPSAGGLPGVCM